MRIDGFGVLAVTAAPGGLGEKCLLLPHTVRVWCAAAAKAPGPENTMGGA